MQRKVIQLGQNTMLVTLPAQFTKEHSIEKGDCLEVQVIGEQLIISTTKEPFKSHMEVTSTMVDDEILRDIYACGTDTLFIQGGEPRQFTSPHWSLVDIKKDGILLRANVGLETCIVTAMRKLEFLHHHYPDEGSLFVDKVYKILRALAKMQHKQYTLLSHFLTKLANEPARHLPQLTFFLALVQ